MNVALPTFVLFILLLPGFVFRSRLKLSERLSLDYSPFGRVVAEGIFWAGVLHAFWLGAAYLLRDQVFELSVLIRLLSSNLQQHGQAIDAISGQGRWVVEYFATLLPASYCIPAALRWLITRLRLDRVGSPLSPWLRFHGAPWYYLLTGADYKEEDLPDYLLVSAVVNVAGQAILYNGVLDDFYVDQDGKLDRLVLVNAKRRRFEDDRTAATREPERFYDVAGDYFV